MEKKKEKLVPGMYSYHGVSFGGDDNRSAFRAHNIYQYVTHIMLMYVVNLEI